MIKRERGFKVFILIITYILTVALFYSWKFRSHWLLRGHMTSNNETVSRQNLWAREQCKKIKTSKANNFQLHNTSLKTGPSGNSKFCFPGDQCLLLLWSLLIETQNLNWQPRWLPPRKRDSPIFRARDVGFFPSLSGTENHDDSNTRSCGKSDLTRRAFSCVSYQLSKIYIVIWLMIV